MDDIIKCWDTTNVPENEKKPFICSRLQEYINIVEDDEYLSFELWDAVIMYKEIIRLLSDTNAHINIKTEENH